MIMRRLEFGFVATRRLDLVAKIDKRAFYVDMVTSNDSDAFWMDRMSGF